MSRHFFITGPARCRSGWLAAFLNQGNVRCFHEAIRLADDSDGYLRLLAGPDGDVIGDSDSGICLNPEWFIEHYPDARFILVHRSFDDVIKSAEARFGVKFAAAHVEKLMALYAHARDVFGDRGYEVEFSKLNCEKTVRALWSYVTYGASWNQHRYDLFKDLEIQVPKTYDLTQQSGFAIELMKGSDKCH